MAVSLSGSVVSEEQTETAEAETADEGEHELLAAAEQKSNLSAGEMTASAADDVSTLRAAGTILVGPTVNVWNGFFGYACFFIFRQTDDPF